MATQATDLNKQQDGENTVKETPATTNPTNIVPAETPATLASDEIVSDEVVVNGTADGATANTEEVVSDETNDVSEAFAEGDYGLDDVEEQRNYIQPDEKGVVVLCTKMEFNKEKSYLALEFSQKVGHETRTANIMVFDPLNVGNAKNPEKARKDNIARVLHVLGAMCPPDKYDAMKKIKFNTFEQLQERMINHIGDYTKVPLKIMVGYTNGSMLGFPAYGACISSNYKPYALTFNTNYLSLTPLVKAKKAKGEGLSLDGGGSEDTVEYLEM